MKSKILDLTFPNSSFGMLKKFVNPTPSPPSLKAYNKSSHLMAGSSALIFSSIGTGAMFSPPAVMMISLILPVM